MKHILRSQQFSREELETLFKETDDLRCRMPTDAEMDNWSYRAATKSPIFGLFYEPSTRTLNSFRMAAYHLGLTMIDTENGKEFSSLAKGESLEDTIHVYCQLGFKVIVLRHTDEGAAERAAQIVDDFNYRTSIINAGDGSGQHPTQALLDVYTIRRELERLDNLTITVAGDLLRGRTARSLVYLMSKFKNIRFIFLAPEHLQMKPDILEHLRKHKVSFCKTDNVPDALNNCDVAYWTRIQSERGSKNESLDFRIGPDQMKCMKAKSALLHPLPRVGEIDPAVDTDRRSAYFKQIRNGMFIRMTLLKQLYFP